MEIHPQVAGFILYCVQRRGKEWPGLYDEMCRVAGRGLYQGLHHEDLRKLGLSFSLNHIEETVQTIESVTDSRIDNNSSDSLL
jgi:hypothetical protein